MNLIGFEVSLIYSLIIFCFSIALSAFFYPIMKKGIAHYYCMPIYYSLLLVSIIFLIIANNEDIAVFNFLGYTMILVSTMVFMNMIAKFKNIRLRMIHYIVILLIFMLLFFHFYFYHQNEGIHILIFITFMAIVHAIIAFILQDKKVKTCKLLCFVNYFILGVYILQGIYVLIYILINNQYTDNTEEGFFLFVYSTLSLFFLFALIIQLNYEKEELIETKNRKNMELAKIFKYSPISEIVIDSNGEIILSNDNFYSIIRSKCKKETCNLRNILSEKDLRKILEDLIKIDNNKVQTLRYQMDILINDEKSMVNDILVKKHLDLKDNYIVYLIDITYKIEAQNELDKIQELLERTKSSTSIGFWDLNMSTRMIVADRTAREIYEMESEPELIPLGSVQEVVTHEYRQKMDEALNKLIADDTLYDMEFEVVTKSGAHKYIHSKAYKKLQDGETMILGTIQDITEYKIKEQKLIFLESYDQVTGLYNKEYFNNYLDNKKADSKEALSIIILQIESLSIINETLGFEEVNKILRIISDEIKKLFGEDNIISRTGNFEFSILLINGNQNKLLEAINDLDKLLTENKVTKKYDLLWTHGFATADIKEKNLTETFIRARNNLLSNKNYESSSSHRKTLEAVMKTLNEKDPLSELHSRKVAYYSKLLANALKLPKEKVNRIETAALLHDIGKIVISDEILTKPGKLTDAEYEIMKQHPVTGYNIMSVVEEMKDIAPIILSHHERIDGRGYPNGLKGSSIPFESKIISIADAFDAMVGRRTYREPYEKEEAILELLHNKGTQFDEELVNTFTDIILKKKVDIE